MSNTQIVTSPSTSGVQVSVEFPILSENEKLVNKNRENFNVLWTLFNAELVALLIEKDPMLSLIVKALQDNVDIIMQIPIT